MLKVMWLIAVTAVILKWPPMVLVFLPIGLYFVHGGLASLSMTAACVLAALSLAIGVAGGALWIRRYVSADEVVWRLRDCQGSIRVSRGHLAMNLDLISGYRPPAGAWRLMCLTTDGNEGALADHRSIVIRTLSGPEDGDRDSGWSFGEFEWFERHNARRGIRRECAVVPFWYLTGVAAISPLAWVMGRWRRLRLAPNSYCLKNRKLGPGPRKRRRLTRSKLPRTRFTAEFGSAEDHQTGQSFS